MSSRPLLDLREVLLDLWEFLLYLREVFPTPPRPAGSPPDPTQTISRTTICCPLGSQDFDQDTPQQPHYYMSPVNGTQLLTKALSLVLSFSILLKPSTRSTILCSFLVLPTLDLTPLLVSGFVATLEIDTSALPLMTTALKKL